MIAHAPVKWCGGKTFLLPEILKRLPAKINTYYEPFVGGGAVFFALAAEGRFKRAVIGDVNEELMITYEAIAQDVDAVIRALKKHVYEEAYYYAVRAQKPRTIAARAARCIYLNKTGFNGLYRVNRKGEFNVPFGRYTNPKICDEENLRAVAAVLRVSAPHVGVHVMCLDFEKTVLPAKSGDVVYIDPPYLPVSVTANFTTYTAGGFGLADQTRLRDVAKKLDASGVRVLLSNSDTPLTRKLYRGFKIEEVQAPRRVNSKGGKRGNVGELLISGRNAK
jgi:DNA adenine methylase